MIIKKLFYLLIVVLILQVIKIASIKLGVTNSYFIGIIVIYIQTYTILFPILFYTISWVLPKGINAYRKRALALACSVVVVGCLETLTLFALNNPKNIPRAFHRSFFYYYEMYDFEMIQFDPERTVYDSSLFYRLTPKSQFVFSNREFKDSFFVNSMGLRDTEASLLSPEIICLGDSYFMGWGIQQSSTFPKLLEKKVSAPVLNAAISSYGTAREIALLKKLDTNHCKAVVIQYCANDWFENRSFLNNNFQLNISPRARYEQKQEEEKEKEFYIPGLHFAMISQLILKYSVNEIRPTFNLRLDRDVVVSDEGKQAEDFLTTLLHELKSFGAAHIYVTMMDSFKRINNNIIGQMATLIKEPRFNCLRYRVSFIQTRNLFTEEDYYFLDPHAKPTAYEKLSEIIADSILSRSKMNKEPFHRDCYE